MKLAPAKIALYLVFALLLATPFLIKRFSARYRTPVGSKQSTLARYGFQFQEVAQASGVKFTHTAPVLDPKLAHIMPQIASMGAGVAVADFDRDGWADFYLTNSGESSLNALYRNQHDGTFVDVAGTMGLADLNRVETGVSMGAVWGDYDNDGFEDLFVYKWGKPELFHNDGGKGFTRTTEAAGFPPWVNANTAVWFDYDRDGKLDLFLGGYYAETVNLWHLTTTKIMPESFEYAKNGGRKYLFHNLGDGKFEEVAERMGINTRRWALAATAVDLRGTGYPDLFIANDYGVSELYLNDGGKGFREVGETTGVGFAPKSGMNAAAGDVFNQGRFSLYVSNISEEGVLIQGNNLWVPRAGTSGDGLKFDNLATSMGVDIGGWSWGAQFGDLNNDGRQDIFLTNGYVSLQKGTDYWYDFSKISGGHSTIISDAADWPPMNGRSLSGFQSKKVWINDGAGRFAEVAQMAGVTETFDGRAVAMVDLWNRGVLDVIVSHQKGPVLIYKNTVAPENRWIDFALEATVSNKSAIGATVRVYWNGGQQIQEITGGTGFCAQNQRRLHFGLGRTDSVEKVEIRWPSGKLQTLVTPKLNQVHVVPEPT